MAGVLLGKDKKREEIVLGGYKLIFEHGYTLPWNSQAEDDAWPLSGGLIINTALDEFYVAGSGIVINFRTTKDDNSKVGILRIDEGKFIDGKWVPGRRMNGDQSHQGRHLRVEVGSYNIQKVKLYTYK